MRKLTLLAVIIAVASFFSYSFSQKNNIGVHIELGHFVEMTKSSPTQTGQRFFLTPYYALNSNTNIGIGGGIKLYKGDDKQIKSFPVYLNALYKFNTSKITPFIEGKVGYSFMNQQYFGKVYNYYEGYPDGVDFNTERYGGLFFSPSVGVLFPVIKNQAISLSLAYVLDQDSYKAHGIQLGETFKGTNTHHFIALRVGYVF